ncbi:MAG: hypothetical protein M3Q48_12570 [Actinomycetota bacterium]|nr:hypothetical protein [Actinomycetota bacterium]
MRFFVIFRMATLLAGLALFGTSPLACGSAAAQAPDEESGFPRLKVQESRGAQAIKFDVEGGEDGRASARRSSGPPGRRRWARPRPPVYYATFSTLSTLLDGTRCVRTVRRAFPSPLAAATAQDTQNILADLAAPQYPPCPGAPRPAATPGAGEAASFWRVAGEDLLPKPQPSIAPGYMLAGKKAYLEAGTVPSAHFTHPTPLGVLTIEATSAGVFVDWGDGSRLDGPHPGPGEPWPNGTITHFWTNAGTYDVVVQQRWTERWRLTTGESGELEALTTEAVIDDFEVRQLQAVRNR